MKESISATTIFQIVILFILLFTAIMCLTINNSNAFGVKDEIINIIEMNNGNYLSDDNNTLSEEIVDAISANSYRTTGICDSGFQGFERNGEPVSSGERASVCIRKVEVTTAIDNYLTSILGSTVVTDEFVPGSYYQIVVFYQLDLPVIRQVYNFQTKGETRIIYLNDGTTKMQPINFKPKNKYKNNTGVTTLTPTGNTGGSGGTVSPAGFTIRTTKPDRTNSIYYNQSNNQLAYSDYEGECAWYARYRAEEILKETGLWSSKPWTWAPNGGAYCNYGSNFTKSKNYNAPKPGALMVWGVGTDSSPGHVAVVEEVYDDGTVLISEAYIGLGRVGEVTGGLSNYDILFSYMDSRGGRNNPVGWKNGRKYNCEKTGCFRTMHLTKSQMSYYMGASFNCYIYLLD